MGAGSFPPFGNPISLESIYISTGANYAKEGKEREREDRKHPEILSMLVELPLWHALHRSLTQSSECFTNEQCRMSYMHEFFSIYLTWTFDCYHHFKKMCICLLPKGFQLHAGKKTWERRNKMRTTMEEHIISLWKQVEPQQNCDVLCLC